MTRKLYAKTFSFHSPCVICGGLERYSANHKCVTCMRRRATKYTKTCRARNKALAGTGIDAIVYKAPSLKPHIINLLMLEKGIYYEDVTFRKG